MQEHEIVEAIAKLESATASLKRVLDEMRAPQRLDNLFQESSGTLLYPIPAGRDCCVKSGDYIHSIRYEKSENCCLLEPIAESAEAV